MISIKQKLKHKMFGKKGANFLPSFHLPPSFKHLVVSLLVASVTMVGSCKTADSIANAANAISTVDTPTTDTGSGAGTPTTSKVLKEYTVTFDTNGGNGVVPPPASVKETNSVTLPSISGGSLTKTGFNFLGWATTSTAIQALDSFTMPANNVTLYAVWSSKAYILIFDANGGVGNGVRVGYDRGDTVTLDGVATFTRAGYTFGGWGANQSAITRLLSFTMPDNNTTLYAFWNIKRDITITFNTNGGSARTPVTASYGSNLDLSVLVSDRSGYTFLGYNTSPTATTVVANNYTLTESTTLYAIWGVTVTYNLNGGTGTLPASATLPIGATFASASAITKSGITAVGWHTDSVAASGLATVPGANGSITAFAIYPSTITIGTQPANISVATKNTATFMVAATSSAGTLTYQWQRFNVSSNAFENIASATNSSYTTPILYTANSGNRYRVVLSDGTNTVNSNVVVSTVTTPTVNSVSLGSPFSTFIDETNSKVYVVNLDSDTIQRTNLDGSGLETVTSSITAPTDVVVYNSKLYAIGYSSTSVTRFNLDGTGATSLGSGFSNIVSMSLSMLPMVNFI